MWVGTGAKAPVPVIVEDRRRTRPATARVLNGMKPAQMVYTHRESMLVTVVKMVGKGVESARARLQVYQLEFGQCH
jgi:hypothetical protein